MHPIVLSRCGVISQHDFDEDCEEAEDQEKLEQAEDDVLHLILSIYLITKQAQRVITTHKIAQLTPNLHQLQVITQIDQPCWMGWHICASNGVIVKLLAVCAQYNYDVAKLLFFRNDINLNLRDPTTAIAVHKVLGIVAAEDANIFKAIRKNATFANCFTFEMPIRSYVNFVERILQALAGIDPRRTFQVLLGHLRNNKVVTVSFELFGVAFLQLFGRVLQLLNTQTMSKILRRVFIEITVLGKMGVSTLKPKGIRPIAFEQLIPNFSELLQQKATTSQMAIQRPRANSDREYDVKTIKGRLQAQRDHNYQLRESVGEHYPVGDKIRNKEKTSISCYMMGGFQIVDYSDSINQLHKKLLTKILLNK